MGKEFQANDEVSRREGIGGSDAYAAANIMTPAMQSWATSQYELFCIKLGKLAVKDISDLPSVKWGSWLEGPVLEKINQTTKYRLRRDTSTHWCEMYPYLYAHIDAYLVGNSIEAFGKTYKKVLAEIKCPLTYSSKNYGEEGTDELPVWTLMQCIHYLVVHPNVDAIFVFVQLPHEELRHYVVEQGHKLVKTYIKATSRFWSFVEEARKNPKMKGGPVPSTERDLMVKNWDHEDHFIKFDTKTEIEIRFIEQKKEEIEKLEAEIVTHRFNVINEIGESKGGLLNDGRKVSLSRKQVREYTPADAKNAYLKEYKKCCTNFNKSLFTKTYSDLVDKICEVGRHTALKIPKIK